MDKLLIEGGRPLEGEVSVSGAKNAALPILCAALLVREPLVLTNVPQLKDVRTMRSLLAQMGVAEEANMPGTVTLDARTIDWPLAPYELVKTMRASILALGPLVARCGEGRRERLAARAAVEGPGGGPGGGAVALPELVTVRLVLDEDEPRPVVERDDRSRQRHRVEEAVD